MTTVMNYGPFTVQYREDNEGQFRFSVAMGTDDLFEDIPYHQLAMAMVLVDRIVDQQLQKEQTNE